MRQRSTWKAGCLGLGLVFAGGFGAASVARAQPCGGQWLPGDGVPGVSGTVNAFTMWDQDGDGPLSAVVVIGGEFSVAGSVAANNIAMWSPETGEWSPIGTGVDGAVHALAALPSGELIVGGAFSHAGGVPAERIARWNGLEWSTYGTGMGGSSTRAVYSLLALPDGGFVAGGSFTSAGGVSASRIARWDGSSWHPLGSGTSDLVLALELMPGGEVVAGGWFTTAGGITVNRIATWNGAAWSSLSGGMPFSGVTPRVAALKVLQNGDLLVGGTFGIAGGVWVRNIARWDGAQWHAFGVGTNDYVTGLAQLWNGDLVISGNFSTVDGVPANRIARWDGTLWHSLGTGYEATDSRTLVSLPNDDVLVGGAITSAGGKVVMNIARWNGSSWQAMGTGFSGPVDAIHRAPDGRVVIGGSFLHAGNAHANYVVTWDGTDWLSMGPGIVATHGLPVVTSLASSSLPEVFVGGRFTQTGSGPASRIARWNGTDWEPLGSGVSGFVHAITTAANGDLIVGGAFLTAGGGSALRVARWNGESWLPLGVGVNDTVNALATTLTGDILAGGHFIASGGESARSIARWNGSAWLPLGTGIRNSSSSAPVYAIAIAQNGDVIAGGMFTSAGGVPVSKIARWDGSAWHAMGSGMTGTGSVRAIVALESGDLIAGGGVITGAGGIPVSGIARWNGASWSALGSGLGGLNATEVRALAALPNGELAVGGNFTTAGGMASAYFARWTDTNVPWVAVQPEPQTIEADETITLSATPADKYANVMVQWRRNGAPVVDGAGGASSGGGTVSGASGALASPTNDSAALLVIENAQASDSGEYTAVFSNACGENSSVTATVIVSGGCLADYNGEADAGDILDFLDFFDDFGACQGQSAPCGTLGNPDLNGDTIIDILDFLDFFEAFGQGC